jgi:adenylyltransferase/sulfurtransferase
MFPEPPPPGLVPSCAEGGVLGILPGVVGTLQATEAIKLILGVGEPLVGRFLLFDALKMRFRELKVRKDPDCPVCGTDPTVTQLIDYEQFCGVAPITPAVATSSEAEDEVTVEQLKTRLDRQDAFLLLDVREPQEFQICRIPGSVLIPLGDLPSRLSEVEGRNDIVVHCKSGVRSGKAVRLLREAGYSQARNLKGGILAWIDRIDPTLPKY